MRMIIVAMVAIISSIALADDVDEAHRRAGLGRHAYWKCPGRAYSQQDNRNMSGPDFTSLIASACPSERQNFRVSLMDYLSLQFPDVDAGAHMSTANNAIASAQREVVTAFIKHKAASK